ncbi:MAG: Glu-tRNA(Gln) amidotransferase subunit GatE [Candidatus Parvarchaeota archaeon]|nr:Glu-tRNA(Gln) amidotransferase subunit GatE [Candidatus Jingweiarchaeum tengchongense]MCW1298529.1 Glu-tRNA(Gln) amidotransferase subunit GatE [Candidatus Jingweiarchaeum tengchongense]MCW1300225.1 Glu-tRNA(Gln) amidotransferase subunit GatE [Candidatus Jingweiarchaeum tengchongense]MCW1304541.1 Glu-tRNA(Gln) amidotransferase subunit GatE [Candidatus Jingweiarchaeum tengchongense]MCW1305731.1 Glu-tRNA(Gln) amidotransferase subunit GatE [Candidatus Jingweiarchaeum tengchongense]
MDWKEIGLKVGLEIHQQLDTHKLFCKCPSILRQDNPDIKFSRKLRAVAGELGEIDIAAKIEEMKNKEFVYEGYKDTTCLVEFDEEPPHYINREALKIAFEVALLLNMKLVDEIHVMRKTVIDGSCVSGFQRTMLIAEDGYVDCSFGRVRIPMLALEEDAARKIGEEGNKVIFRLDRAGIPLIEIRTEPDMHTPDEVRECAEKIGLLLRITGKMKRGLGTIRQDVNVSIKGGERVEIKGAQALELLPKIVEYEVIRQKNLIRIKDEIRKKLSNFDVREKFYDITKIFHNTNSILIKNAIQRREIVLCVKIPKLAGYLKMEIQPGKSLGKEIAEYLFVLTGIKGFIHSDELPGYGISENEINEIKKEINVGEGDLFLFVFGKENEAKQALNLILRRIKELVNGVMREVRQANEDGTTSFMRPMPGAARMYPETDHIPIQIDKEMIKKIKIPERPEEKIKKFVHVYGLSEELAEQILWSKEYKFFEECVTKFKKVKPSIIAKALFSIPSEIKKCGLDPGKIEKNHYIEVFKLINDGKVAKEAMEEIFVGLARNPLKKAEEIVMEKGLKLLDEKELDKIIKQVVEENKDALKKHNAEAILMGILMKKLRGKADGELINKKLKAFLN